MNSKVALTFISAILLISCNKDVIVENDFEILDDNDIVKLANSNASLTSLERLGKAIYFDPRFSEPINRQSCSSCHSPENGWVGSGFGAPSQGGGTGAIAGIPEGAVFGKYGGRASPSAAYATLSPVFRQEKGEVDADFVGGLFWDGRATGRRIPGNPAAEQALGPLLSPVEQNHVNPLQVLNKIITSESYLTLWNNAFGTRTIPTATAQEIEKSYQRVGIAIAAYEGSLEVNSFSSKYDAYLRGEINLTPLEKNGLQLFNSDAKCFRCHTSESVAGKPVIFSDFKYYNLGIPKNLQNPRYWTDPNFVDLGLGGYLKKQTVNISWREEAEKNYGKFKTPTLRNVGKGFNRRYMHNGAFKTLEEVVHFYNTRDDSDFRNFWPSPEYGENIQNGWMGNLGLTPYQESAVVAFLKTLTDGFN
ncbi:MAG: hypothetical protein RLZZ595_350, partial [Bacteroidota bacterium]